MDNCRRTYETLGLVFNAREIRENVGLFGRKTADALLLLADHAVAVNHCVTAVQIKS